MKIQILMSTYNGSQYIRTQLDSIVAQDVNEKFLLIRDDGSTDDTIIIIEEYIRKYPWIFLYKGQNVGVQKSFFDLINKADSQMDYIAFADQDDEWLPNKLSRAVWCLNKRNSANCTMPLLYCSDKRVVGKNLEPINVTVSRKVRKISFGNALVQNICTGCTAVINQSLLRLIKQYPPENIQGVIMHDWWLYLTAACFGNVYYDHDSYIKYRQHGGNASGAMLNHRALMSYRINQLFSARGQIYKQAEMFLKTYTAYFDSGWDKERNMIRALLCAQQNFFRRVPIVVSGEYFRQKITDDIVFRAIMLIGKL